MRCKEVKRLRKGAKHECEPKLGEISCKKRTNEHLTQPHLNIKGRGNPLFKKATLSRVSSLFLLASHRMKDILGGLLGSI